MLDSRITKVEQNHIFGPVQGKNFPGLLLCRRDSRNKTFAPHHLQSPLEYSGWKHAAEGWKTWLKSHDWNSLGRNKFIIGVIYMMAVYRQKIRLKGRYHPYPERMTASGPDPAAVSVEMNPGDTARWKSRAWRAWQNCRCVSRIKPAGREPASACIHWVSM